MTHGNVTEQEEGDAVSRERLKPWPQYWLLRFVKHARLNHRIGGGLGPSIRVAWKDARRGR